VKVDLEAVLVAFSDDSVERTYYLDGDSGRVFNVREDQDDPETRELVWALESDSRGRYIQVPKPSMEETLKEQDAFVESLDGELKEKLDKIIQDDHDGSKFSDFVERNRQAREAWRDYRALRSRDQANEWVQKLNLPAG
jgi:hypothetical protein